MRHFTATCALCGGEGEATYSVAMASWLGEAYHQDPEVCRYYLELKKKNELYRKQKEEAEIERQQQENQYDECSGHTISSG